MVERGGGNNSNKAVVPTYRDTTLGLALQTTLTEMVAAGDLGEGTRDLVLSHFDIAVFEQFS